MQKNSEEIITIGIPFTNSIKNAIKVHSRLRSTLTFRSYPIFENFQTRTSKIRHEYNNKNIKTLKEVDIR